jgi:hypothetical protein
MKKLVFCLLALSVSSSCAFMNWSVFQSGLQIPAGEEFLLGEYEKNAFRVVMENSCFCNIPIETRNAAGEVTASFNLPSRETISATINAGEYAVLKNPYSSTVAISVGMSTQVSGMRYEKLDSTELVQ